MRVLAGALVVGITYAALGKLIAVITTFGVSTGATFWPGAGLTLAVLLLRPRSEWRYYLTAVGIAEVSVDIWEGFDLSVALGWAVANTAEPFTAAWLLTRRRPWDGKPVGRQDLSRFVLAAILAGPLVGALIGTAVAAVFAGDPWLPRLGRWYVGDAIGVLVVAPALLAVGACSGWRPNARAAAWFAVLALISLVALGPWELAAEAGLPFLTLPVLIVIAMRFGTRGAAGGVLIVATVVEAATASGRGPFAGTDGFSGLLVAQMFVAMSAATAHTVAMLTTELIGREQLESELRSQAMRDSLTGLANRRLLFDRIEHASRRLARRPGVLALLYIDLDGFKKVNDTHGHRTGDAILIESADRLRAIVRDHDSIARLGGDEFLILAEDMSDVGDAVGLAARVVAAFDEPFDAAEGSIRVTASVGVCATSAPIRDREAYVSSADRAMYAAKRAGGGRVAIHGPRLEPAASLPTAG